MRRWLSVAPAGLLVAAAGCLASKSDIRLLQDELRVTRAQLAQGDTSILRADDSRRQQIATLSDKLDHAIDSLRSVAARLANFQAAASGNFDVMNQQILQMQTLLGQATRSVQDTRLQLQALKEQSMTSAGAPVTPGSNAPASAASTPATGATPPPGSDIPGPATLWTSANESIAQGAYGTARRSLETLVTTYPQDDLAPRALLRIGETYSGERNLTAADSVYRLVADKYPRSNEAGLGLYRVGKALWDAGKKSEATQVLNRVIRDYPNSDAARLAKDTLNPGE